MNFELTPEQQQLQELAKRFAQKELAPHVEEDEAAARFRPEKIRALGELGLTGIPVPEAYGGSGLGYQDYLVAIEELASTHLAYAISVGVTGLTQVILSRFGTEDQRRRYIPPMASGQAIGSFALSEPSSGSDAGNLRTTAVREGDQYVLNGTKLWITQADVASTLLVMARTGGAGPKGISTFILEKGMPGLSCGKAERKMGVHSSHTMELLLNNVRVPAAQLVGKEGDGFKIAMTALDSGRLTIAASAIGIAQAALGVALNHARQREQFGRPIGEFQGVSFLLADMATEIDAARLLTQRAAWLKDNDKPFSEQSAMAKFFATDVAMKVTTDAVQIMGGSGYTQDFPVERYMREAKVLQIVEGTNQIQRMIIGRGLMQPRS